MSAKIETISNAAIIEQRLGKKWFNFNKKDGHFGQFCANILLRVDFQYMVLS